MGIIISIIIVSFFTYMIFMLIYATIKNSLNKPKEDENVETKSYTNNSTLSNQSSEKREIKNKKRDISIKSKDFPKYVDPTIEFISHEIKWPEKNIKFECGKRVEELIREAVIQKRNGNYKESSKIYKNIINSYGPSGIVYYSWAKTLMCEGHYIESLMLLRVAMNSHYETYGFDDQNFHFHIDMIENRLEMSFNIFHDYMKSISGNSNYKFPAYSDVVLNLNDK